MSPASRLEFRGRAPSGTARPNDPGAFEGTEAFPLFSVRREILLLPIPSNKARFIDHFVGHSQDAQSTVLDSLSVPPFQQTLFPPERPASFSHPVDSRKGTPTRCPQSSPNQA